MISPRAVKVAEWVGAALAGLALIMAASFWLLSRGPISLDWLAPYVAATLTRAEPGLIASVDHTMVRLAEGPRLDIVARGIHLSRADGRAELYLPSVTLSLSPEAMLTGQFAPERIALSGPRLRLLRAPDGSFHIALEGEQPATGDWAEALLRGLAQPPDRHGAFGYLSRVEVRDASLEVDDRKLGATWEAKRLDATLVRRPDGLSGDLALTLNRGGHGAEIHGDLQYRGTPRRLLMSVSFEDLRPALYATAAPALRALHAFDLPLGGQVSVTIDPDTRRVTDFWCDLRLGKGRIVDPKLAGGALAIMGGALRIVFDPATKDLHLERFSATLDHPDGPKIDLVATVKNFDPLARQPLDFSGKLHVSNLRVPDFPRLWPEQVAFHARHWIMGHLLAGDMPDGNLTLSGTVGLAAPDGIDAHVDKVDGTFSYRGVTISYFGPLTPVSGIDGTAHFNRQEMDLHPKGGVVRDAKVSDAKILLTELDTNHEQADIDFKLAGPLVTVLDELNRKPLRYADALGIDTAHVAGGAEGHVHFHLPMKENLKFSQIDYAAQATLDRVAIDRIFFNRDLSAGNLRLAIDRTGLKVDGTARLQGVPVTLAWIERFGHDAVRTRYHLDGRFDAAARQRLGIDWLSDLIAGPIGVDLVFARRRSGSAETEVNLDLTPAAVAVKRLGWTKKAGQPETAKFTIDTRQGEPTRITGLRLDGSGLVARADITLTGSDINAGIARVDVQHLTVGRTDLAGEVKRRPQGGWAIKLQGNSFDAAPLFDALDKPTPAAGRDPPLAIVADLSRVYLAPDRIAEMVRAQLYSDGLHWETASIDAAPAAGSKMSLRFGPVGNARQFRLTTDNLGALLRLLDISSRVRGGRLSVTGHTEDSGPHRILRGSLTGGDYRVVGVPAFARLLSAASLTGAAALVSGAGIPFERVQGNFMMGNGAVQLSNARAYGEAIGINAHGRFDYRGQTVDLRGTVVPSYLLNSFLGNIPVLGDLLLGGQGQGIFAANFHVAGPMADPGISVNALSALAPGFLRRLFLFDPGTPEMNNARRNAAPKGG